MATVSTPKDCGSSSRLTIPWNAEDARGREEDRVARLVRVGRVPAEAADQEVDRLGPGRRRPLDEEDRPLGLLGRDVEGDRIVRPAHAVVQPVGDHRGRARDPLLRGLADEDEPAPPAAAERLHGPGQPDERGHVQVVAAGVHDRDLVPVRIGPGGAARVRQTGRLLDGKGVHVGPDEERRPGPVLEHGRDAVPANPPVDRAAGRLERVREPLRRAGLLPRELGVRVERAVELEEVVVDRAGDGPGERRRHGEYMAGAEDKPRG